MRTIFCHDILYTPTVTRLPEQNFNIFSHHLCESKYINWSSVVISAILPLPLPSQAQVNLVYKYLIIASKENV